MITQNPLALPSAQNAQIWMATALAGIQPAATQIGGSARVLLEACSSLSVKSLSAWTAAAGLGRTAD